MVHACCAWNNMLHDMLCMAYYNKEKNMGLIILLYLVIGICNFLTILINKIILFRSSSRWKILQQLDAHIPNHYFDYAPHDT
jgi:hypothetical protein